MKLFSLSIIPYITGHTSNRYDAGRSTALAMLVGFLLTFVIVRAYTRVARIRGWRSASIAGVHTHHLVFGLVIAFFAGAVQFALLPGKGPLSFLLALIFGGGAAMVLDEFALAVHLQDVYWEKEGRKSVDAVIIGAIFGTLFLLHVAPFGHPKDLPRLALTIVFLVNMVFVLMAAVKGKIYLAIFGVFVPLLALLGAIRLAEPDSIWARRFYNPQGEKMSYARERYSVYEKTFLPLKERLIDIVGGKTGRPHNLRDKRFTPQRRQDGQHSVRRYDE
jgi:hypothetical protein